MVVNLVVLDECEWLIVKFYEEENSPRCKIYRGTDGSNGLYWKPESGWEPLSIKGWGFDKREVYDSDDNGSF